MAKDPAMLWYWNDWQGGTVTLSRHLKGCYIDLLHAQFNNGHLSMEEIKTVLGPDLQAWETLQKKFECDEKGLFFNKRLEQEQEKRRAFAESRRKNVLGRYESSHEPTYVKHTNLRMENENEDVNEDEKGNENKETFDEKFIRAFDEITCERFMMTFPNIPKEAFGRELQAFRTKCDNDQQDYHRRDLAGLRHAFQYQLKNYRPNGKRQANKQDIQSTVDEIIRRRNSKGTA